MRRVLLPALVLAVAVAGCSRPGPEPSRWRPPDRYAYTLESTCGEQYLVGRVRLWVDGGAVVRAQGLDEAGQRLAAGPADRLPTLDALLDVYNDAVRGGADRAELSTDPGDGHPVRIEVDPDRRSIDDESCFAIDDYAPGAIA